MCRPGQVGLQAAAAVVPPHMEGVVEGSVEGSVRDLEILHLSTADDTT